MECVINYRSISLLPIPKKMSLDDGCQLKVAFLDFSKAFDGVSYSVLFKTLCSFGFSESLLLWCES